MDNSQLSLTDKAGNNSNITLNIEHICHFVDGVCPDCGKSEYEEIELTQDNLYMTGITTTSEDYNTPTGEIIIPSTFEYNNKKYKVTSINCSNVWEPYHNVTSLILPNTITNINSLSGFRNCEYVTIPESVTTIKSNPVNYFDNLKILYWNSEQTNNMELSWKENFDTSIESTYKVVFGENVTIIPYIFNNKGNSTSGGDYTKVKEIEIINPNAVIREKTFERLTNLEKINLPSNLKRIEKYTFSNCSKLSDLNLNGVEFIGEMAFQNTGFISLILPDTLKTINGNGTFSNCKNLISVNLNKLETLGSSTFSNCPNLNDITWSNYITVLESGTFSNCTSLTEISIPNSITELSMNCFYNCTKLKTVILHDNIERFSYNSQFYGCTSLMNINIPKNLLSIPQNAFYNCTSLTVTIPNNVFSIGENAFYNVPHIYYNGSATGAPWGALAMN